MPKLERHLEARLWNDVFAWAEERLDIPPGTIKATVLIETILAAFEMDEILYELRDHSAGLNCRALGLSKRCEVVLKRAVAALIIPDIVLKIGTTNYHRMFKK